MIEWNNYSNHIYVLETEGNYVCDSGEGVLEVSGVGMISADI